MKKTTKKYEFTNETIDHFGRILHRIRALRDFGDVKAGDLGSFVETEDNLSHDDNCWVYGDARVYGKAWVFGDARVYGKAWVYGNAWVFGDARVFEYQTINTGNHDSSDNAEQEAEQPENDKDAIIAQLQKENQNLKEKLDKIVSLANS